MAINLSALDRLRKAANLEPIKKEITLSDGSIFEMYVTPLTMAERDRAQRLSKDDNNNFALQLLLTKALDETGRKLFNAGEIDVLKNEVKDPRLNGLTVTRVEVSKNLKKAYIYYSSSNSFNATDSIDTNKGLQKATGFIRKLSGQRIKIKRIPEICFEVDRSEDLL